MSTQAPKIHQGMTNPRFESFFVLCKVFYALIFVDKILIHKSLLFILLLKESKLFCLDMFVQTHFHTINVLKLLVCTLHGGWLVGGGEVGLGGSQENMHLHGRVGIMGRQV